MEPSIARRASGTVPAVRDVLELLKPITWFPPMWAFACGVASAGGPTPSRFLEIVAGVLLAGPLVCATSQAVNDWFDRHVDAINEPHRPIPSGRIPGAWGLYIACLWTLLSLFVAAALGPVVMVAASVGLLLAWLYSAPPVRLKRNGWWGNSAVALCYEGLPWVTGAAVIGGSGALDSLTLSMALLYSVGAHGIMTLNDFKSVEGDRATGVGSLPVRLGPPRAARVACFVMALPQVGVVLALFLADCMAHGIVISALLVAQLLCMVRLLQDARKFAPWYNATGISLYVLGMLVAGLALGGLQ